MPFIYLFILFFLKNTLLYKFENFLGVDDFKPQLRDADMRDLPPNQPHLVFSLIS